MITIQLEEAEQLTELLPYSGVFEWNDCYVRVKHFPETPVAELEKIEKLLGYAINILDIEYQTIQYGDRVIVDIDADPFKNYNEESDI